MNDRPDLAMICEADGVHIGQDELSIHDVRRIIDAEMLIGVSTHSIEQARHAFEDNADYIGVGPVFPSQTKELFCVCGFGVLRLVQAEKSRPAFAIGGINRENLSQVLETGTDRIAVGNAVLGSPEIPVVIEGFLKDCKLRLRIARVELN